MLCREVFLCEPSQFKPQTRKKGNAWKAISKNLMASKTANFLVHARAVRERLLLAVSGISPENNSLDDSVEEIIEKIQEAEKAYEKENVIEGEKKTRMLQMPKKCVKEHYNLPQK